MTLNGKMMGKLLQRHDLTIDSLVFSFWTTTLDLIEIGLNEAKISFVRFDGRKSQSSRLQAMTQFRTDPTIRVMLLTLSCGATG
jgi:SWI/SNF-related matrix-associated actin-dependent regulator of chromatin subfamily A3